jgi:hypothetical protein
VIFTFFAVYGASDNLGHYDMYPNGGSLQPSCFGSINITNGTIVIIEQK